MSTLDKWKEKNRYCRPYAHFDERVELADVWDYINNPNKVSKHGFYPFIHYSLTQKKFYKKTGIKEKTRDICFSSHVDRYIFAYYSYKLNQLYNERIISDGTDDVAIAYRDNKKGKSNIHYAKKAFDIMKEINQCYVIIGDFKSFFDELSHSYLKERLIDLLKVDLLPDDYYAVFKNITRFSYWELDNLFYLNDIKVNMNEPLSIAKGFQALKESARVLPLEEFKKHKKENVKRHDKNYGIPQGSAMSAVLSNIYMIDFDKQVHEFVSANNGLYMRYSDDFIIILPMQTNDVFLSQYNEIRRMIGSVDRLVLEPKKTQIFTYNHHHIESRNTMVLNDVPDQENRIHYLGFSFDGNKIMIRDKTISKYYYRMYRKLNTIILDSHKLVSN